MTQRLDLPVHPNLLTALEAAHHAAGSVTEAILNHIRLMHRRSRQQPSAHEIPHVEIEGVPTKIGKAGYEVVVADLGSPRHDRLDFIRFHVLIVVGLANPVGIARMVRSVLELKNKAEVLTRWRWSIALLPEADAVSKYVRRWPVCFRRESLCPRTAG